MTDRHQLEAEARRYARDYARRRWANVPLSTIRAVRDLALLALFAGILLAGLRWRL